MPEVPWLTMRRRAAACYLVTAMVPDARGKTAEQREKLLSKLLTTLPCVGNYALQIENAAPAKVVLCLFAKLEDALCLSRVVGAGLGSTRAAVSRNERVFALDDTAVEIIRAYIQRHARRK